MLSLVARCASEQKFLAGAQVDNHHHKHYLWLLSSSLRTSSVCKPTCKLAPQERHQSKFLHWGNSPRCNQTKSLQEEWVLSVILSSLLVLDSVLGVVSGKKSPGSGTWNFIFKIFNYIRKSTSSQYFFWLSDSLNVGCVKSPHHFHQYVMDTKRYGQVKRAPVEKLEKIRKQNMLCGSSLAIFLLSHHKLFIAAVSLVAFNTTRTW